MRVTSRLLSKQEFVSQVLTNSPESKIVVFAAAWCGFCRRFIQLVSNANLDYSGEVFVVDADSQDESLWDEYDISIVPTIVVFKDGKALFRADGRSMIGLLKGDLERAVSEAVSAK